MVMDINENINALLKYIDEHLEENVTTRELAQIAGYSEYHFIKLFKKYTNTTVTEYVCRRKLIKASEDIINGMKIIDVAFKYGWQSHSGFTKAFNREFGFYPSLLRAMIIEIQRLGGSVMSYVFMESTKVGATKEELLEVLQTRLDANGVSLKQENLMQVYGCACKVYEGVKRYSGEEYVTHTINVAIVLAELGAEENVILSGMLCDVNKKGTVALSEFKNELPQKVYSIVDELQKADKELLEATDETVIIKLAERLHNMRTIEFIDESKKKIKAKETIEIFMPLARKLGNEKLIDELNDLAMKYYAV